MYHQMTLFDSMPKEPKYKHPSKAQKIQYSLSMCDGCGKLVFMPWKIHGHTKYCPICGKEFDGWMKSLPGDKDD